MTGPEITGTLRRPWRYSLLAHISDDEGNFDPDAWERLTEKVAGMVVEAQAEAWDAGMEYGVGEFGKPLFDSDYTRNPYRATVEDQAAMAISAEAEEPMPPAWADAFESVDATRAHVDELERAIDRVRNLHSQDTSLLEPGKWCPGCGQAAPCSTARALTEPKVHDEQTRIADGDDEPPALEAS